MKVFLKAVSDALSGFFNKPKIAALVVAATLAAALLVGLSPLPAVVFYCVFALLGMEFLLLLAACFVKLVKLQGREVGCFIMILISTLFAAPCVLFLGVAVSGARAMMAERVQSGELPIPAAVEGGYRDFFAKAAEIAAADGSVEKVVLRSLDYVKTPRNWKLTASFNVETTSGRTEWQKFDFMLGNDGRLISSRGFGFSNKKAFDVLKRALAESFRKYAVLLPRMRHCSPVIPAAHAELVAAVKNFAAIFKKDFPLYCDVPDGASILTLGRVAYHCDVVNDLGEVFVECSVLEKSDLELRFVYKDDCFEYVDGGVRCWNAGNSHIMTAANSALDQAVARWLDESKTVGVRRARPVSKNRWTTAEGELPAALGKMTFIRKPAHPFLAEYYRKLKLSLSSGLSRTFRLPVNTGGRTSVRVFLVLVKNEKCVRLRDHSFMDVAIRLRDLRSVNPVGMPEGRFVGAFMGVTTPLRYVPADSNDAERIFSAAADRGYELPLRGSKERK